MNHLNAKKLKVLISFILLIIISFISTKISIQGIFPTIYVLLLITLSLVFIRSEIGFIIFIYIVLFPLDDILPGEAILLPGINIIEIVSLILIIKYLMNFSIRSFDFNQLHKLAIALSFFFLVIYFPTFYIKHYFIYGSGGINELTLITRLLKLVIQFICIFIIVDCFNKSSNVKTWTKKGLIFGIVLLSLNIYMTSIFVDLGMSVGAKEDYVEGNFIKSQAMGLFAGDGNYFSHYMLVSIGFFLSIIEKKWNKGIILCLLLTFPPILLSGSKAALICVILLILIFIIRNFLYKGRTLISLIVILLFFVSFNYFGAEQLEEFYMLNEDLENVETYNRYMYQKYYFNEMMENKTILIGGHWDKSSLYTKYSRWRNPHNQYLGMIFWGGLPYLFVFLIILYKIFKCNKTLVKSRKSISIIYPLIAFIFMYIFNPNKFINYFPIVIILASQYFEIPNKIRNNNSALPTIN